jgi:hypothetical protein
MSASVSGLAHHLLTHDWHKLLQCNTRPWTCLGQEYMGYGPTGQIVNLVSVSTKESTTSSQGMEEV